mgnify:CR=1 FL=1
MKYIFILFALPLFFPHLLQAQAAPWVRAIYEHNGDIIVLTNNFALLSLNKEGKATILQEPDENLKEIASVFLQDGNDNAAAFLQKDGSYIFFPNRYDRRKAYTATPKGNRKYLNANPNAFDPLAIWSDEKSLVLEMLKDHSEMVIPLPGKPVSAIGQLGNLVVTIEPDNQPGTLKNFKITGKDMKNISPLNMGGQVAVFFPGDKDRDIIAFLQRKGTQMDSMFYNYRYEKVKVKLPKPGIYRVAAAHSFANIILVNENQEYWLFKGSEMASERPPFFTKLTLPGNQKIITAGFLSDPYLANFYLVGADHKAYHRQYNEDTYTPTDLAALRKLPPSTIAGTQPATTPSVPAKKLSLSPVADLNLSQQSNEMVKDYYAAVFPAFSDEDLARWIEYADLDNDGKKDMIISYDRAPYFDVFYGDGRGLFPKKARIKYGPGKGLLVKAADFNKDKKADLLICHPADSSLTLFTQTATNSFKGQKLTAEKSNYFELIDYNADKLPDIVLDGAILLNNGSGQFIPYQTDKTQRNEQGFFVGEGIAPSALGTMADLNGDGTLDFIKVTGSYKGDKMTLYGGIGIKLMPPAQKLSQAKTNTYLRSFTVVANENMHSIGAGDFDGNGTVDLVVSYQDVSKVSFFMNKGNGESFEQKDMDASAGMPYKIEVFDFDKDGKVEAAINIGLKPQLFGIDSNGKVVRKYQSSLDTDIGISTANGNFADLNGDGLPDYIALNDHKAFAGTEFDCGAERCFSVNSFLGSKSGGSFAFTEKTMPVPVVTYTTVAGVGGEGNTGVKTGGKGGTNPGTQTPPAGNYRQGVAKFKGVGERLTSLVIEIEAQVLYENKQDKGVYGFRYQNIVDAKGIRFRYPGNSAKWYSFGSGDYVHKCTESNGTERICATIQGAVFILGIPDIY